MGVESKTGGSKRAMVGKRLIARSELSLSGRRSSSAFAPIKRVVLSPCHSNDQIITGPTEPLPLYAASPAASPGQGGLVLLCRRESEARCHGQPGSHGW